jgi:excisionase family DNA binding protein
MTVMEAACRLDVDYDWVLRMLRRGKLKGRKRGRVWFVDPVSVEARLDHVTDGRHKGRKRDTTS